MKRLGLLVLGVVVLLPAPSAAPGSGALRVTKIGVTTTEFKLALSTRAVKRGTVVFAVVNRGIVGHDFRIAGKKTPLFERGEGGALKITFAKPGRYTYLCDVPGHADSGMRGVLEVQ